MLSAARLMSFREWTGKTTPSALTSSMSPYAMASKMASRSSAAPVGSSGLCGFDQNPSRISEIGHP